VADRYGDEWTIPYEQARRTWPGVALAFDRFRAHVDKVEALAPDAGAHVDDLFLACACATGDRRAIEVLEQRYLSQARFALERLYPRRPDFVDDVMQEARVKMLLGAEPRIARYAGRGDLVAWLRVAVSRTAIDLLRAAKPAPAAAGDADPVRQIGDTDLGPEVAMLREAYRDAFNQALAAVLRELSAQDRNLLRRHLVDHLTLQEMSTPYGVHPATVARRLAALRHEIAEAVREKLAILHREEGGATSLESMAQAIRSEVHISLTPLLGGGSSSGRR
jgi:RNA polymerase sigma-70 factor (ECF subfamily)